MSQYFIAEQTFLNIHIFSLNIRDTSHIPLTIILTKLHLST